MKKSIFAILFVAVIAGAFLAGSWHSRGDVGKNGSSQQGRQILYYVDPMNPAHTSKEPGPAPCGMPLEPVYSDDEKAGGPSLPPGAVKINSQKQQLIGVRVSSVEKTSGIHTLRTIARVAPDETRIYKLISGAPGFIREVSEATTGSYVKKDEWLAGFSSPDSLAAIQACIAVFNWTDRLKPDKGERSASSANEASNLQQRVEKLQDLGISAFQIEEIKQTREIPRRIKILSPVDGFVLSRNVSPDQRFDRGAEWYRVADLSRVWIVADVFEREAQHIKPGMSAKISLPHQGKIFKGTVTQVPPQFDSATRTLKVRLETDNPGFVLRPDMFVDVEFQIAFPPAITVPSDAVLDTGLKKTVFVDLGGGYFDPRTVETGWRFDDRVEVVKGLALGEKIVVSGNFLIDSESRMKLAAEGLCETPENDPMNGKEVNAGKAKKEGLTITFEGKTYYFSSAETKVEFEKGHGLREGKVSGKEPSGAFVLKKQEVMNGFILDPVCGMVYAEEKMKASKYKSEYRGITYYLCSDWCKSHFDADPVRYVKTEEKTAAAAPKKK
jgi:membrane fusion protein, copper/silver efflux system